MIGDNTLLIDSRAFRGDDDFHAVTKFVDLRQPYTGLPDYWHYGQGAIAVYVTMYAGPNPYHENDFNDHRLWCDNHGAIRAYTHIRPESRQWRIQVQSEYRTQA